MVRSKLIFVCKKGPLREMHLRTRGKSTTLKMYTSGAETGGIDSISGEIGHVYMY